MKTLKQVLTEKSELIFGRSYDEACEFMSQLMVDFIDSSLKEYATEAIKADRKRVSECAYMKYHCGHFKTNTPTQHHQIGADNIQIDKESILNLPIELP